MYRKTMYCIMSSLILFLFHACGTEPVPTQTHMEETGLSLSDLPEIPGAVPARQLFIDTEHLVAEYLIPLDQGISAADAGSPGVDAAAAFLERMQAAGWTLVRENRQRRGGEFTLRKDTILEVKATITATSQPRKGKMQPCVAIRLEYLRRIPFQDIAGCDPVDVPRYPGSVRVRWMHLLGDFVAKYLVSEDTAVVREYLNREILKLGWKPGTGAGDLNYTKDLASYDNEPSGDVKATDNPVKRAAGLVPTTLSITVSDNEGITQIGVGRTSGGSDRDLKRSELETAITPPMPEFRDSTQVPVSLDIDHDIPVYKGLALVSRENLPVNHRGEDTERLTYTMDNAPMKEALAMAEFYMRRLDKAGWELVWEEWFGIGRTLNYSKGALGLKVNIKAVGRYPVPPKAPLIDIPVTIDVIFHIPRSEAAGEDIPGVARYPGSVRFFTLKVASDHIVKYKALARRAAVEHFFIDNLPRSGWHFAGNDSTGMLFIPADTAESAAGALASGKLVPTTLKIKVDHFGGPVVMIGMDRTRGD